MQCRDRLCNDVVGSVGNQRGVVVREKCAVVFQKVQQMRHLFEIGTNVRIVSAEMDVIKLNM